MTPILHIAGVNYESMVDGDGVRTAIYLSGCAHHCPGCHNPETHDPFYGTPATPELIHKIATEMVKRKDFLSGFTLTGGDPFYSPPATSKFLTDLWAELLDTDFPVSKLSPWIYTGYTLDELLDIAAAASYPYNCVYYNLLGIAEALVDGRFVRDLADKSLAFRGSSNQRIWTHEELQQKINPKENEA